MSALSLSVLSFAAVTLGGCGQSDEPLGRSAANQGGSSSGSSGTLSGGNATGSGGNSGHPDTGGAATTGGATTTGGGTGGNGGSTGGVAGNGAGGSGAAGANGGTAGNTTGTGGVGAGGTGAGGNGVGGNGAGGTGSGGVGGNGAGGTGSGGVGGSGAGGSTSGGTAGGGTGTGGAGTGGSGTAGNAGSGPGGSGGAGGATDAGGTPDTLHFVVYGDTRTGSATHQKVIDQIAQVNPDLVIHSGDLWDGYTQAMFTSILTKNANIGSLLNNGLFVVSRGNHETVADYLAFKPSLSRGNTTERFSYTVGNSYFVVLGMDPTGAATFLDGELKKPEATAARWRFVQSHYPVYSGGTTHGASGIPSIEKLCDTYHVAVYWSGHDHIYERSHQVYGGQIVDKGDALSVSNGTVYVVSGGGGAPLYGVAPLATTHIQQSTNNYVDVVASPTTLTVNAYQLDGSKLDTYAISQ